MGGRSTLTAIFVAGGLVSGCGLSVPEMKIADDKHKLELKNLIVAVLSHIRCEIREAAFRHYDAADAHRRPIYGWAAKIYISLKANEQSNLNADASFAYPIHDLTLGLGGKLGADATREMTLTSFLPFDELIDEAHVILKKLGGSDKLPSCDVLSRDAIAGNLKFEETFGAVMYALDGKNTLAESYQNGPIETITHNVTFVISGDLSASPKWSFQNVRTESAGGFLGAGRKSTDEVVITVGPGITDRARRTIAPSPSLQNAFDAERLKSAVRTR
jgi:hypothetical protein